MNKKGITNIGLIIISFALVSISYFFLSVFIFEGGKTYLIEPTADIGRDIIEQNTDPSINSSYYAAITAKENEYSNFAFPFDLFFLLTWIIAYVGTVVTAFKVNKEGVFSFMGSLFVGSLLILLITVFVSDFTSWFLSEIFNKVFSDTVISMVIFNFYVANLGLINFIWWISIILINIIDRTFISRTGEAEE